MSLPGGLCSPHLPPPAAVRVARLNPRPESGRDAMVFRRSSLKTVTVRDGGDAGAPARRQVPASASHPLSSTLRSVCFPSAPEAGRFRWPGRGAGLHLPLPFCVHPRAGTRVCPVESFPAFMILREEAKEPDVRAHRASSLSAPRCWVGSLTGLGRPSDSEFTESGRAD